MEQGKKELDAAPWLLITDGEQNEKQYMYSLSEDRVHPWHDPELEGGMTVLGSAYGWLVLSHLKTFDTFLWNPRTMDKIHLESLVFSFCFNKCVMSKPPSEPDCNLVFFSTNGFFQGFFRLLGDRTVVSLWHPEGDSLPRKQRLLAAAAFRGTVYGFLLSGFRFVVLHFGDESVEFRPVLKDDQRPWDMPDSSWHSGSFWEYHMIESQQEEEEEEAELLLVKSMRVVDPEEFDFRVFRVDVDRKECVELDNIGDRGIFLSNRAGGLCCSSSGGFRPNCIYYTLEQGQGRCVFVYDMNDRSTRPLLPCPDASRTDSQLFWVQNQVFDSPAASSS